MKPNTKMTPGDPVDMNPNGSGSNSSSGGSKSSRADCDDGFKLMSVSSVRSMVPMPLVNTVAAKDANRDGWLCLLVVPGVRKSTQFVDN